MEASYRQSRNSELKLISDARVRKVFDRMMYGCAFCEIVVDAVEKPVGYSVVGYNDALSSLAGTRTDRNADQTVSAFLNKFELLPAMEKVYGYRNYLVWEQYLPARQRWYSISAFSPELRSVVLMFEDVSQRKKLETKLEEERKRYQALLKQSSDAIVLVDVISKRIIDVNSRLCQMSGYKEEELYRMNIYHLLVDTDHEIDECQSKLARKRYIPAATRWIKCKDGSTLEVERVGSLIKTDTTMLELLTFYDVSEERRLQQILNEDAALASQVQRQMLPSAFRNKTLEVAGIYKPLHMVSGDFFDYRFSLEHNTLTGFVVDVAGHGLATALQTAAINVLLQDVILRESMPNEHELHILNRKMKGYFDEGSFATLIIFHFDFVRKHLSCACCGINQFLTFCREKRGWLKARGNFIGTFDDPVFDIVDLPIQSGDCFYFLTDGFSDKLNESILNDLDDFTAIPERLTHLARSTEVADDCSAVCIKINDLTNHRRYDFSGMDDVDMLQKTIRQVLADFAGNQAVRLEIALNEAVNNVLMHGSGQGHFVIKRIGRLIVMRVKDAVQGFDVQSILQPFDDKSMDEIAQQVLSCETGRGLLIIKRFTDRIYYNVDGSEIMLVCRVIAPDGADGWTAKKAD